MGSHTNKNSSIQNWQISIIIGLLYTWPLLYSKVFWTVTPHIHLRTIPFSALTCLFREEESATLTSFLTGNRTPLKSWSYFPSLVFLWVLACRLISRKIWKHLVYSTSSLSWNHEVWVIQIKDYIEIYLRTFITAEVDF